MSTTFKSHPSRAGLKPPNRRLWKNLDWGLLLAVILLVTFGIAMIRSSTFGHPNLADTPTKQIRFALTGMILLFLVASIDYRFWQSLSRVLYFGSILLLAGLFITGVVAGGAQRWFDFFGLFFVQPSELAKIGSVIWIASFFARRRKKLAQFKWVLISIVQAGIPVALVMAQPNLSSAVMIIVVWASILWAAGLRWQHLVVLSSAGLAGLPALWMLMQDYQRARIANFINPSADLGAQYNIRQAIISIGSGGWFGQGYNQASQVQLRFLKVRHTDFIFSAAAAEFGLIGVLVIMILLILVVVRILRIATVAKEPFGAYICYGMAAMIFAQTFLNIGMNLNLLPVIGLPLPFVSYGGSALLTLSLGIGLVQSVAMRHRKHEF